MRKTPLDEVKGFIQMYGDALGLHTAVQDTAIQLLENYTKKKGLTGRGADLWAASFIQLACKLWSIPTNARIINGVVNIKLHPHNKQKYAYTLINKVAKIITRTIDMPIVAIPNIKYVDMVLAGLPHLSENVRTTAYKLLEDVEAKNINVGYKQVFASTIVFLAAKISNEHIIESDCITQLKISEVGLRNCKRRILAGVPEIKKRGNKYSYNPKIEDVNVFGILFRDETKKIGGLKNDI